MYKVRSGFFSLVVFYSVTVNPKSFLCLCNSHTHKKTQKSQGQIQLTYIHIKFLAPMMYINYIQNFPLPQGWKTRDSINFFFFFKTLKLVYKLVVKKKRKPCKIQSWEMLQAVVEMPREKGWGEWKWRKARYKNSSPLFFISLGRKMFWLEGIHGECLEMEWEASTRDNVHIKMEREINFRKARRFQPKDSLSWIYRLTMRVLEKPVWPKS